MTLTGDSDSSSVLGAGSALSGPGCRSRSRGLAPVPSHWHHNRQHWGENVLAVGTQSSDKGQHYCDIVSSFLKIDINIQFWEYMSDLTFWRKIQSKVWSFYHSPASLVVSWFEVCYLRWESAPQWSHHLIPMSSNPPRSSYSLARYGPRPSRLFLLLMITLRVMSCQAPNWARVSSESSDPDQALNFTN